MNFYSGKPIVRYDKNRIPPYVELNDRADVYALDHPLLGSTWVSTSKVREIFYSGSEIQAFETTNTIYVLDTYVIPEKAWSLVG